MKTERSRHVSIELVTYAYIACDLINLELELRICVVVIDIVPTITRHTKLLHKKALTTLHCIHQ